MACLALLFALATGRGAFAQGPDTLAASAASWSLVVEGRPSDWAPARPAPLDSLNAAALEALRWLQSEGHYFARIDSVTVDTMAAPPRVSFFARRGADVRIGRIRFDGLTVFDSTEVAATLDTRVGQVLQHERLEADIAALLERYERAGYPLAQVRLDAIDLIPGQPPRLDVRLVIDEGRSVVLQHIELVGAERTKPQFVARLAGLRTGTVLTGYAPEEIRRRLEETPYFRTVGMPELRLAPDSGAVLRIPVTEEAPGAFDLVLGYVPGTVAGEKGAVVGNGHIELQNLFGRGREMSLRLNRMTPQASSVEVRVADPFVFGLPFGVAGHFDGLQQDSTYAKQAYRGEVSYELESGLRAVASFSRERTQPGQAGRALLSSGRQRIARSEAWFGGFGIRYQRLDRSVNPSRGLMLSTSLETGSKERSALEVTAGDTVLARTAFRQQRLQAEARAYVPTARRQVLVAGLDAALLVSDAYDVSDLFRFGGARTLRGYNEAQFAGRTVGRLLAEYRLQIERTSYAFAFFDLGYVDQPPAEDEAEGLRDFFPGYGLGIQFQTNLGLINVSAALNPDDGPTSARIHAGLSFGL